MNTTTHETQIHADPQLPTIRITREFDAPRERVFRAYTDPALFVQWIGPRSTSTQLVEWNARTGGNWRYTSSHEGEEYTFYGSFHEVRPNERIVQTFTYEGVPDGVFLETATFEDLGNGRTRVTTLSVTDSLEARDGMIASGMEHGVVEGHEKLDQILAES